MTQDRTPYAPPPNEKEWANAQRDYLAGRVLGLRWHHRAATVERTEYRAERVLPDP